ncbi:hypothetical protein LYNGBM3L_55790 [Moorena producens 3L]|uniref:Uncharacterized protein n=1 Tax=Moorena producens 3L TaxID=489825 RepID=F4XR35_9CYAN|nr:hypothetical protein LYNGBM3L_55790 [Moorena producens 3L]
MDSVDGMDGVGGVVVEETKPIKRSLEKPDHHLTLILERLAIGYGSLLGTD